MHKFHLRYILLFKADFLTFHILLLYPALHLLIFSKYSLLSSSLPSRPNHNSTHGIVIPKEEPTAPLVTHPSHALPL